MDPSSKSRTISAIKAGLDGFSPQMRVVGKYIVDNPSDFGLDPIRVTASKAGASTYTLVRIAEALGLESFEALRAPFRHALVSGTDPVALPERIDEISRQGEIGRVQAEAARNSLSVVQHSLERQSPETIGRVVDWMLGARKVYVAGARASYAMAYYFQYVGRMALPSLELIPRHVNPAVDDLHDAGREDVMLAIATTPYSSATIEACRFAQARNVRIVLLSDSEIVAPDLLPDITLRAASISTHHFACYSGIAVVLEGLLSVLLRKGGDETAARIASHEALRAQHDAYWSAEKNG